VVIALVIVFICWLPGSISSCQVAIWRRATGFPPQGQGAETILEAGAALGLRDVLAVGFHLLRRRR
jgi:hypothetical protein